MKIEENVEIGLNEFSKKVMKSAEEILNSLLQEFSNTFIKLN